MKKQLLLFSLILLFFLSNMIAKDWKEIRIGVTDSYPPFSMLDSDGKLIGFDIEIAHALCKSMNAQCIFLVLNLNYDDVSRALFENKVDAVIASLSITEERKKKVAFTNKYYYTAAGWVAKKGKFNKINHSMLAGKRISVLNSSVFEDYLNANYTKNSDIIKYKKLTDVYSALKTDEIDIFMADVLQVNHFF